MSNTRRQEQRERTRKRSSNRSLPWPGKAPEQIPRPRKRTTKTVLHPVGLHFASHCLYWSVFNAWLSTGMEKKDALRYTRYIFAGIIPEGWKKSVHGTDLLGRYIIATHVTPWNLHKSPQERLVDYATMQKVSQE